MAPPSLLLCGVAADLASWLESRMPGLRLRSVGGPDDIVELAPHEGSLLVLEVGALGTKPVADLLRRLRSRAELRAFPVALLLDSRVAGEDTAGLAAEFGVWQSFYLPQDRERLASQVSELAGVPLQPATQETVQQRLTDGLAALWKQFRGTIMARVEVLDRAAAALREGMLIEDLRLSAEREAHKLAGSIGTFGFKEGSGLSSEIESMLHAGPLTEQTRAARLVELIERLHRELDRDPGTGQIRAHQ